MHTGEDGGPEDYGGGVQRIPDDAEFSIDDMLADLRELVEVESPSLDVDALSASAKVLAAIIERRLGGTASLVDSPVGPHVHWVGGGEPKVLLLGHHDTVFPAGTLARRPFEVVDGRATGPGVFDMLGGIVQALHGLAALDSRDGVEILFSADEEVGSIESRSLIEERAAVCGAVLVLEPSADGDLLKTGRKGTGTFEVTVHGRAAHAGLEPEKGVNALIEASRQVLVISEFGAPDVGTTVTPTVASAGTADNVVPAEAWIRVERPRGVRRRPRPRRVGDGCPAADRCGRLDHGHRPDRPSTDARVGVGHTDADRRTGDAGHHRRPRRWRQRRQLHRGPRGADARRPGRVGGGAHADTEHLIVDAMPARARLVAGLVAHLTA